MFEVEIKIKLEDSNKFLDFLSNFDLKHKFDLLHIDSYYNMPLGLRDFQKTDEALRIRKTITFKPEQIYNNDAIISKSSDFTYKGAKIDKLTKTRIEYVCNIDNSEILDKILQILGFRKILDVKKERKLFEICYNNEKIQVTIDKIEQLDGYYSEFEIQTANKNELDSKRELLFDLIKKFGISEQQSIRTSYLELILEKMNFKNL